MARAITFLLISLALFILASVMINPIIGWGVLEAGCIAIGLALLAIIFPNVSMRVVFWAFSLPFRIMHLFFAMAGMLIAVIICLAELAAPALFGWLFIKSTYSAFADVIIVIGTIIYIALWLAVASHQWRAVKSTWRYFEMHIGRLANLLENVTDAIMDFSEKMAKVIHGHHAS